MTRNHKKQDDSQSKPLGGYTEIYRTLMGDRGKNGRGKRSDNNPER